MKRWQLHSLPSKEYSPECSYSEEEMIENLGIFVARYNEHATATMTHRIWQKRRELGLL
jgi:hypothetical protein